ncbi:MAG: DUF502 domain-containing protein [Candidatus Omnitrophota bacterium]
MFKRLRNDFLTGLIVVLPIILTIIIFRLLVVTVNSFLLEPIINFFPALLKFTPYFEYIAKFFIFVLVVLFIILVGLATKVIIIRNIFRLIEKIFTKLPMVNKLYIGLKQLSGAFFGTQVKFFEKVILVEYPRKGIYSIGFVAVKSGAEISKKIDGGELFNVFLPTSPNPTSGVFIIVPKEQLIFLDMSVEEALKLILSAGKVSF